MIYNGAVGPLPSSSGKFRDEAFGIWHIDRNSAAAFLGVDWRVDPPASISRQLDQTRCLPRSIFPEFA